MSGRLVSANRVLAPGESLVLSLPEGTKAVTEAKFSVTCDETPYADAMNDLLLTASFDGTQTVSAPLADFSGAGPEPKLSKAGS